MPKRPRIRFIYLPIGSNPVFAAGRGDCYGWRWWIGIGPLTVLIGRAVLTRRGLIRSKWDIDGYWCLADA